MGKDNTKDNEIDNRISIVEDKRTIGLKSDLQKIADIEQEGVSSIVKKALVAFVKAYKARQ